MNDNVYDAPSAVLVEETTETPSFYIVSIRKFWVLFIVTVSLYLLYWCYKHWSNYRLHTKESLWPVPRAIFSIFFAHSLFEKIDNKLKETSSSFSWSPSTMASLYVLFTLINTICSRLADRGIGSPYTDAVFLIAIPFIGWTLSKAQRAANIACADPQGQSNSRMTAANVVWLIVFGILWILGILGIFAIMAETA